MGKSEFTFLQHIVFFSLLRGQHTTSTGCTVLYKSAKLFVTFLFEMRRKDTHTATQSADLASPCSRNCIANLVGGTLRGWALLFPCVFRKPIALTKPGNFASSSRTRRLLFSSSDEICWTEISWVQMSKEFVQGLDTCRHACCSCEHISYIFDILFWS